MIFRHLLAASVALAFLSWLLHRGWRRLPLFGAYLACQLPLLFGFRPEDDTWLASWWLYWQPAVLVARALATWEAYWVHTDGQATKRARIASGACLIVIAIGMMVAAWGFRPSSTVSNIVQIRRSAIVGMWAFLFLYLMASALRGILGSGWRTRHYLLHFAMMTVLFAVILPGLGVVRLSWSRDAWHLVDDVANLAMSGLMLVWALLVPTARTPAPQAAGRDARDPGDLAPRP